MRILVALFIMLWVACTSILPIHPGTEKYVTKNSDPFLHGVASGDPLADRVIIWTRVTTANAQPKIEWSVARDSLFAKVVKKGVAATDRSRDYTVKIDVTGLDPGTTYYYRFASGRQKSVIGRTRTTALGDVAQVRLAVVSCSNFEAGYFNAYARIAEKDLDAVLHLGDYIYEYGVGTYGDTTLGRLNVPSGEIFTVDDYRTRYALYRLDKDLQEVHRLHPFITVWDDHEIANNAYVSGAQNHQAEEGPYLERVAAARKAYYEWLPIRQATLHYRSFQFGKLASLIMLDERLAGRTAPVDSVQHDDYRMASRTMLGEKQLSWFKQRLQHESLWKVIGNQVIFSGLRFGPNHWHRVNLDAWDGWPVEQQDIKEFLSTQARGNTVFVTGDTHASWAMETPLDNRAYEEGSNNVAVEFGTTSITSANMGDGNPHDVVMKREQEFMSHNVHLKYSNMRDHGYLLLTLKSDEALAQWYYVDTVKEPSSRERMGKAFRVVPGQPRLIEVK